MTMAEANAITTWGRYWHSCMWIRNNSVQRDVLINHVNGDLNAIGITLHRGWRDYDPVIRRNGGRPSTYAQIAAWAASRMDGGVAAAQQVLDWALTNTVSLTDLPDELLDFVFITHLAEFGRGYSWALDGELYPWLEDIVNGIRDWNDYQDYSPALRYAEDSRSDWLG